ncbi:RHS repeat-associated core domain-containing protein [Pseudomonas sp.]|uniref:RHS repeat-associated core domain-containing protein n=1 Tax=Pseudomonas sp. TaxID=306 RepID=UPI001AFEED41|nr:RHS repeat-associated core domain-containing protein [Pseudomonas sp.]MBO9552759.1 RHS repeat-associated core domain-containing protein [Pseudomonas sp.]
MRENLFYSGLKLSNILSDRGNRFLFQTELGSLAEGGKGFVDPDVLLVTDALNSTVGCVSRGSCLPESTNYTPYGFFGGVRAHQYLASFVGQRFDERIEGYHLGSGYRIYSPILMRFLSFDSWSPFGKAGINGYVYCGNNPVNAHDPTGHITSQAQWRSIRAEFKIQRELRIQNLALNRAWSGFKVGLPSDLSKADAAKVILRAQEIHNDFSRRASTLAPGALTEFVHENPPAMYSVTLQSAERTRGALMERARPADFRGITTYDRDFLNKLFRPGFDNARRALMIDAYSDYLRDYKVDGIFGLDKFTSSVRSMLDESSSRYRTSSIVRNQAKQIRRLSRR